MLTFIYCDFIAYFGREGDISREFFLTNSASWIAMEVNNRQHCREKICQLTKNLAFATTRNYNYRLCKTIRFSMVTFIYCDFIAYFGRAGDFSRQFYLTNSTSWIAVEVNNRQHCREKKCQLTKNLAFATTRNYNYRLCKTIRFYMVTFIYCDFIAYFGRAGDFKGAKFLEASNWGTSYNGTFQGLLSKPSQPFSFVMITSLFVLTDRASPSQPSMARTYTNQGDRVVLCLQHTCFGSHLFLVIFYKEHCLD